MIISVAIFGCEHQTTQKQDTVRDPKLPELLTEKFPSNADFFDHILYSRRTDGFFFSLIVINNQQRKRMVIPNGLFMEIYFNGKKQKAAEYRRKMKPVLERSSTLKLTNSQWLEAGDFLLDLSDTLGVQYEDTLYSYFKDDRSYKYIPKHTLLKLAHEAFLRKKVLFQDDYSGYYFVKSYKDFKK